MRRFTPTHLPAIAQPIGSDGWVPATAPDASPGATNIDENAPTDDS